MFACASKKRLVIFAATTTVFFLGSGFALTKAAQPDQSHGVKGNLTSLERRVSIPIYFKGQRISEAEYRTLEGQEQLVSVRVPPSISKPGLFLFESKAEADFFACNRKLSCP